MASAVAGAIRCGYRLFDCAAVYGYVSNLKCTLEDPLTDAEMEAMKSAECNCRLIKRQVFLWPGAKDWHDLWDEDGTITP